MLPKFEPTRPAKGIGAHMILIVTAQELRSIFGNIKVNDKTLTQWIDASIAEIERDFLKHDLKVLMEVVAPDGSLIDHTDGRLLNPGHAIECAWFLMHEGRLRNNDHYIETGCKILDYMWERGWDKQHGGLLYFADVKGLPVQEYWHDMKFWWPHNEAIIATLLAWKLTGNKKYADMHKLVHDWSFKHFPDTVHGEWYGYLHRDGSVS
jgi:N-acylglucosamine 2-epimerase